MYISDTDRKIRFQIKRKCRNSRIIYIAAAIFCFIFRLIYGMFSHGVSSIYMTWAFIIPLVCGLIAELSFHIRKLKMKSVMRQLLMGGAVWLMLGSLLKGVIEIYGTTNGLTDIHMVIGVVQIVGALAIFVVTAIKKEGYQNC